MKNIKETIKKELKKSGVDIDGAILSHPKDLKNGDFSFFVKDKTADISAFSFAELKKNKYIKNVVVVGQFINIYLSDTFFRELIEDILKSGEDFGKNSTRKGELIIFEYTDPNPFKELVIL